MSTIHFWTLSKAFPLTRSLLLEAQTLLNACETLNALPAYHHKNAGLEGTVGRACPPSRAPRQAACTLLRPQAAFPEGHLLRATRDRTATVTPRGDCDGGVGRRARGCSRRCRAAGGGRRAHCWGIPGGPPARSAWRGAARRSTAPRPVVGGRCRRPPPAPRPLTAPWPPSPSARRGRRRIAATTPPPRPSPPRGATRGARMASTTQPGGLCSPPRPLPAAFPAPSASPAPPGTYSWPGWGGASGRRRAHEPPPRGRPAPPRSNGTARPPAAAPAAAPPPPPPRLSAPPPPAPAAAARNAGPLPRRPPAAAAAPPPWPAERVHVPAAAGRSLAGPLAQAPSRTARPPYPPPPSPPGPLPAAAAWGEAGDRGPPRCPPLAAPARERAFRWGRARACAGRAVGLLRRPPPACPLAKPWGKR